MTNKRYRLFMAAAFAVVLVGAYAGAAHADSDTNYGNETQNEVKQAGGDNDFDSYMENQSKSVGEQLEELKAKTKVTHKPLVDQKDAPYFDTTPEEDMMDKNSDANAPEATYIYKKRNKITAPSRSFNNVQ